MVQNLVIPLRPSTLRRITAKAKELGLTPEALAIRILDIEAGRVERLSASLPPNVIPLPSYFRKQPKHPSN